MKVNAMHSIDLRLSQIHAARARQRAEAAQDRLGRAARAQDRGGLRRAVGRSLIRLGSTLAAEPEPTLQPARPR
jgi:hypothetical protein